MLILSFFITVELKTNSSIWVAIQKIYAENFTIKHIYMILSMGIILNMGIILSMGIY